MGNKIEFMSRAKAQNEDDKTWYVNEYTRDDEGIVRRETIADDLSEEAADALVKLPAIEAAAPALYEAALAVLATWGNGDLAAAVQQLQAAVDIVDD